MSFMYNEKAGAKVSRPPGGQSSDIFGPPVETDVRRRVSNSTKSSIFDQPDAVVDSPSRSKRPPEDTQNKLFGEPEPLPPPRPSTVLQEESNGKEKNAKENGTQNGKCQESNGGLVTRVRQPPGGVSSKLW